MILGELRGYRYQRNLKRRKDKASWPIAASERGPKREEDATFDDFQKDIKKPERKERERATCI